MIVHKYLFVINKGKITVLNYDEYTGKLNYETNKGEKTFLIEEDFWNWWVRATSFTVQQDKVDFCFIYDMLHPIMNHEFEVVPESSWEYSQLEGCFEELEDYYKIILKGPDDQWQTEIINSDNTSTNGKEGVFYTTLQTPPSSITKIEEVEEIVLEEEIALEEEIEDMEISPLARLFIEKLQKEKEERIL